MTGLIHETRDSRPYRGYGRVSKKGGRDGVTYISPDEQRRTIQDVARAQGVTLLDEILVDEDRSGGNFDRPFFQQALAELRAGQIAGIVVPHLDRFSRSTEGGIGMLREFAAHGGQVLTPDGRIENGLITTVRLAYAEDERQRKAEGLRTAQRRAVQERGVSLNAAYGYRKPAPGQALVVEPAEAEVVHLIFDLRAAGWSNGRIAARLNEGTTMRSAGARWAPQSIRKVIVKEVYTGVAVHGDYRKENAHPAIVTRELWEKANRVKGTRYADGEKHLLTGLVRCSSCGRTMPFIRQSAGNAGRGYYQCKTNVRGGVCSAPASANAEELEALVMDEFERRHLHDFIAFPDDTRLADAQEDVAGAKGSLQRVLRRAVELDDDDEDVKEILDAEVEDAKEELRQAKSRLRAIENELSGAELPDELDPDVFRKAPVAEKRHWLSLVFAAVVVRRAVGWREPVAARSELLTAPDARRLARVETAPRASELIDLVPRLRWSEAGPRVDAA
jgi:DNA invertase Pin-like site-specific DNA recombinase